MADILIREMDMPDCCEKCPFLDYENGYCFASKKKQKDGWYDNGFYAGGKNKRHDNCPLVALPKEHGRLIDGDELASGCDEPYWCRWLSEIEDAPTIVPAELGESDVVLRGMEKEE